MLDFLRLQRWNFPHERRIERILNWFMLEVATGQKFFFQTSGWKLVLDPLRILLKDFHAPCAENDQRSKTLLWSNVCVCRVGPTNKGSDAIRTYISSNTFQNYPKCSQKQFSSIISKTELSVCHLQSKCPLNTALGAWKPDIYPKSDEQSWSSYWI